MQKVKNSILSKWRLLFGILFVMTVFVLPGTKGMFAKFFNVTVEAGGRHNHSNRGGNTGGGSRTYRSVSCPRSNDTASPMSNTYSSHSRQSRSLRSGGSKPNAK